tara:strand:+ start:407 stop:2677 length:2271 start_codon:yes stop_codon:yes gene_type:complete
MFKLQIQLYIERILSGSKSYLASHPELGVPIGIFNYRDEPDYESRVKSIKKYGKSGNPLSRELAKLFGVDYILPSYNLSEEDLRALKESLELKVQSGEATMKEEQRLIRINKQLKSGNKLKKESNKIVTTGNKGFDALNTLLGNNLDYIHETKNALDDVNVLAGLLRDSAQWEGKYRSETIIKMGVHGALQKTISLNMQEATIEAAKYGVTQEELISTISSLSSGIGRNLTISDDTMSRLAVFSKVTELGSHSTARMMEGFDRMGLGIDAAIDKGNEMRSVAVGMGVNVGKFMETVAGNMNVINSYNFEGGVKGFAKMVAQAQKLGISMSSTVSLADKVMDPEGAINLAAQLQVIGGAVGDLADPFKMMYMATNDLEGLQDAMVSAGEQSLVFNQQTGEFGIPPTEIRRMKAMAEQLPISYDELVTASKRLAKEKAAISQMDLGLFGTSDEEEQLQSFIAGMAQFENGQYKVQLKSPDGKTSETIALEDLTNEQKLQFEKSMKATNDANKAMDGMAEKDIMFQSMTYLQKIAGAAAATKQGYFKGLTKENQAISESEEYNKVMDMLGTTGAKVTEAVGATISQIGKTILTGEEDMTKVMDNFKTIWGEVSGEIKGSGLGKWFTDVAGLAPTSFNGDVNGTETSYNIPTEKDAFTSGAALIIPKDQSQTPYMTSSFDNTYTTPDLGYGEIGNSMSSEGKTNKHEVSVNVTVNGMLKSLGFKSSDIINDHQLMMALKKQLDITDLTGKAVGGVLTSNA